VRASINLHGIGGQWARFAEAHVVAADSIGSDWAISRRLEKTSILQALCYHLVPRVRL